MLRAVLDSKCAFVRLQLCCAFWINRFQFWPFNLAFSVAASLSAFCGLPLAPISISIWISLSLIQSAAVVFAYFTLRMIFVENRVVFMMGAAPDQFPMAAKYPNIKRMPAPIVNTSQRNSTRCRETREAMAIQIANCMS